VLDQFTRWQAMNWDFSGRLQKAQMDTTVIEPDLGYRLAESPHYAPVMLTQCDQQAGATVAPARALLCFPPGNTALTCGC